MSFLRDGLVLVPWDSSESAMAAIRAAVEIAGERSRIRAIHVIDPPPRLYGEIAWPPGGKEAILQKVRDEFEQSLPAEWKGIHLETVFGNPGNEIVQYAKRLPAGLIVISTHGRTGLLHFAMGSVAERVVRLAPCPVLVLRSQAGPQSAVN